MKYLSTAGILTLLVAAGCSRTDLLCLMMILPHSLTAEVSLVPATHTNPNSLRGALLRYVRGSRPGRAMRGLRSSGEKPRGHTPHSGKRSQSTMRSRLRSSFTRPVAWDRSTNSRFRASYTRHPVGSSSSTPVQSERRTLRASGWRSPAAWRSSRTVQIRRTCGSCLAKLGTLLDQLDRGTRAQPFEPCVRMDRIDVEQLFAAASIEFRKIQS